VLAAVKKGDEKELAELIRQDPGFDVNAQNENGWTLLHYACGSSSKSPLTPTLLLAQPNIDVNLKTKNGSTPFCIACEDGSTSCIREMLKDSRVKVNEADREGHTPLWRAANYGRLDIIKWWIASGREIDLGKSGVRETDAIGRAKERGMTKVVTLLERFKENPVETRHAMRVELGLLEDLAAEMFALVVFVSDEILQIKDTTTPSPAARYFKIAAQLPLELQMVLCYRVVDSSKEIIPGKDSEVAFKSLARTLLWSSMFTR